MALEGDALTVKQTYQLDEPTAIAISACGGYLVVGTKSGGARGGGKLVVVACTAGDVAMGNAVELESPHANEITAVRRYH